MRHRKIPEELHRKFPKSALYRYLRSGANLLLVGRCAAATPRSEEQAACRVGLRLQRKGNSSIGWVMLWSTPDAQTSSIIAHPPPRRVSL
jgi:hypothetical protein